jgi:predicted nucleotidyltransferase
MLRDRIVEPLRSYFARAAPGLVAAYLFGSVARGQERPDSDVDIGVVLGSHTPLTLDDYDRLAQLQDALAGEVAREVDLVALDHASPDLVHRVLRDRILLHDGDHDARSEFEIRARNEFFDLQPFLEAYRRAVLDRA